MKEKVENLVSLPHFVQQRIQENLLLRYHFRARRMEWGKKPVSELKETSASSRKSTIVPAEENEYSTRG